jgi:hypothetical protein
MSSDNSRRLNYTGSRAKKICTRRRRARLVIRDSASKKKLHALEEHTAWRPKWNQWN